MGRIGLRSPKLCLFPICGVLLDLGILHGEYDLGLHGDYGEKVRKKKYHVYFFEKKTL